MKKPYKNKALFALEHITDNGSASIYDEDFHKFWLEMWSGKSTEHNTPSGCVCSSQNAMQWLKRLHARGYLERFSSVLPGGKAGRFYTYLITEKGIAYIDELKEVAKPAPSITDKHRTPIKALLKKVGIISSTGDGSLNRVGTYFRDGKIAIIYQGKKWQVIDGELTGSPE